uniref:Fibronectin type III domain containing 3A n=1 Tax=Eptatretus burgeri TaxID=7764 RepID=A0A8C4NCH8_EPTBU
MAAEARRPPLELPFANGDNPLMALMPGTEPPQQVIVVHVNVGETFTIQSKDGSVQCIPGPAQVPMMSPNGSIPPIHIPPGYVSQVIEDNGVRRVVVTPQTPEFHPQMASPHHMHPHYIPHRGQMLAHPPLYPAVTAELPAQFLHQPPPTHVFEADSLGPHGHQSFGFRNERTSKAHERLQKKHQGRYPKERNSNPTASPQKSHSVSPDVDVSKSGQARSKQSAKYSEQTSPGCSQATSPRRTDSIQGCGSVEPSGMILKKQSSTDSAGIGVDAEAETGNSQKILLTLKKPQVLDVKAREARVTWNPPVPINPEPSDGPMEIDAKCASVPTLHCYELSLGVSTRDSRYKIVYRGEELKFDLKDLKPATDYHIRVCAMCDSLRGVNSDPTSFTTLHDLPDTPLPPKLSNRTKSSLLLQWKAPPENGSKITAYLLEWDEGHKDSGYHECYIGGNRQYRVAKLSPGTGYCFRLAARNELGLSGWSESLCFVTQGCIPSAPPPPQLLRAGISWLALQWHRPVEASTDESVQFVLEMDDETSGYGFKPKYHGEELSYTAHNMHRSSRYKFRLFICNSEGMKSVGSEVVTFHTLSDRPGPPARLTVKGKVHAQHFKVSWDPPKDNGGASITKFQLEMAEANKPQQWDVVYSGHGREHVCDQLQPGNTHSLRCCCYNVGGQSQYSDVLNVETPPLPPGAPPLPRLVGKSRARELHLRWGTPAVNGGCAVLEYTLELGTPGTEMREVYHGPDVECTVHGLLPGRPYKLHVRAANRAGAGPFSEEVELSTGPGAPEACQLPTVTCRSATSATVSWESPLNNGAEVTEYRLEWGGEEGCLQQVYSGPALSYELRGLQPASYYFCRVQAVNCAGPGLFGDVASCCTPPWVPGPITTVHITSPQADSGLEPSECLVLSWDEPISNGAEVTTYNVDYGERQPLNVEGSTSCIVHGLHPDSTYRVRVQAVNAIGPGPFSQTVRGRTLALPPEAPRLECVSSGPQSLRLKWGESGGGGGGGGSGKGIALEAVQFTLQMQDRGDRFVTVYAGSCHTFKVQRLSESSTYTFRVRAANEAGDGPFSEPSFFTTTRSSPPPVKGFRILAQEGFCCDVSWESLPPMKGDNVLFVLQLAGGRDPEMKQVYKGLDTSYRLTGLQAGGEYRLRVCAIRRCQDGAPAELFGPFGPTLTLHVQKPQAPQAIADMRHEKATAKTRWASQLTDEQWAGIILVAFAVFSIFMSVAAWYIWMK